MLSVLITAYNEYVVPLVETVRMQCREAGIRFEIIVCDDHSSDFFRAQNEVLAKYEEVTYHYLDQNIGRAKIRNLLASLARYQWFLFMDGDSEVVSPSFIRKYLDALKPGTVLCGGRTYSPLKPEKNEYFLHWKYGTFREQRPASLRNMFPYRSFMTSNFLCPSEVFFSVTFDETISGYGHEDTLFGYRLQQKGIPLVHTDNPLMHGGLVPAGLFLQKGKCAVKNLAYLFIRFEKEKEWLNGIRMVRFYVKLKKWHLVSWYASFQPLLEPVFQKNLRSKHPVLLLFDLLRLFWLIEEINNLKKACLSKP